MVLGASIIHRGAPQALETPCLGGGAVKAANLNGDKLPENMLVRIQLETRRNSL